MTENASTKVSNMLACEENTSITGIAVALGSILEGSCVEKAC